MEFFTPRKLKFKAWNKETKLMMRLHSIDNLGGEFSKKEHILLQFTGLYDLDGEEVYDVDVLLHKSDKIIVHWSAEDSGWRVHYMSPPFASIVDFKPIVSAARRLGNYFELNK